MSNPAIYNYSTRNIFVWNNRFNSISATYTNSTGSEVTLTAGMLIGRVAASGLVKQAISTATDGSQVPIGVLTQDYTVANGDSVSLSFCIQGDVDYGMLVFGGSPADTISTVISLTDSGSATVKIGTIGDILNGKGILPINTSEMTYQDNQ
jgi:hypothetical protein